MLAAAERGETVSPDDAKLAQGQLLKAARQSDDPEFAVALQELAFKLAGIRERALKEKLESAGQDPWAGRAWLAAQAVQEAERQKQVLGLVGEGQPSELQELVAEFGVKRERVLEAELDLALGGELPREHARGVALRALEIERSKQLLGRVEGDEPSELYRAAETVLRR